MNYSMLALMMAAACGENDPFDGVTHSMLKHLEPRTPKPTQDALSIVCPEVRCKAGVGQPCKAGTLGKWPMHRSRVEAAKCG